MEDRDKGKLFVGGISWETTDVLLRGHFAKYGTVVASVIAKDRNTGSPRGFAFVSFSDPSAVDKALQDTHEILGRTVEVKKAIPRGEQQQNQQQNRGLHGISGNGSSWGNDCFRTKKIFVGGLSANLTEAEFRSYFQKFGRIMDVVVMHDNVTHRPRGFGFITFDSEDAVEDVMQKNFHELTGKLVEVKRAVPKEGNSNGSNGDNARVSVGRGSANNSYHGGNYLSYSPSFDILPGYGPVVGYGGVAGYPYGSNIFVGGYPSGGYSGIGYGIGMGPVAPGSPWGGTPVFGLGSVPLHYASAAANIFPSYLNGGLEIMNAANNGDNEILGADVNRKLSQFGGGNTTVASGMTPIDRGTADVKFPGKGRGYVTASQQNQRSNDGQFRHYSGGNSS